MKKILFTVAALGLGIGLAASVASAEMSFSAKGKYEVQGFYVSEGSDSGQGMQVGIYKGVNKVTWTQVDPLCEEDCELEPTLTAGKTEANDMWHHSLYVFPTLQVNDNIALKSEIRMIDRDVWGSNTATGNINTASEENMRLRLLWMDYMSPVGTFSVGRILGGGWGSKFLDTTGNRDRIKWATNFMPEPFGLTFIYQKGSEKDAFTGSSDEMDVASYYAGLSHKADFGNTDFAVWHNRIDKDAGDYDNTELWFNAAWNFGAFNVGSEINYGFGDDSFGNDISSLGAMVDVSTKMDAFTIGGLFIYLQGDMDDKESKNNGYIGRAGVGNDYNPFAIATGDYMGLLNADKNGYLSAVLGTGLPTMDGNGSNPGMIAAALYAGFQASEKLGFNGAAGYIWADDKPSGMDSAIGWEVDLGLSYKLLDNLTYSATAAYMEPGDMIDDVASAIGASDTNSVYLLLHNLTMTF